MVERLIICFSNKSRSAVISEYSSIKNFALFSTVVDSSICGGPAGNCQLLNGYDLIGGFNTFKPKFAKRFGNVADVATNALKEFVSEVKANTFPDTEHSYSMIPSEIDKFKQYLESKKKG